MLLYYTSVPERKKARRRTLPTFQGVKGQGIMPQFNNLFNNFIAHTDMFCYNIEVTPVISSHYYVMEGEWISKG